MDSRIENALHYIDIHFSESPSIQKICEMTGLSKPYFIRLFHKTTGLAPAQYIMAKRLSFAAHLMMLSSDSFDVIAASIGFKNYNNFSNQFQKQYGLRPKEYRKKNQATHFSP